MTKKNTNSVKVIVVDADGEIITAANGRISSDNPALTKIVKELAEIGMEVQLVQPFGNYVRASLDPNNLIGITAALFSAKPGRTRLLEAPDEVWDWWNSESSAGTCHHTVDPAGENFSSMSWDDMELAAARELFGNLDEENPQGA